MTVPYNPTADRDYWRCEPDADLIEAAKDSGHELCIALGERLADLVDVSDELSDALDELKVVRAERDALLATVADYERAEG
jgi:4-alpha-glucanotransferase